MSSVEAGILTRRQCLELDNALAEIERLPGERYFTVRVAQLREILAPLVAEIRAKGQVPEAMARLYANYESARILCARAHAAKDGAGQPVQDQMGSFVIPDHAAFVAAIEQMRSDPQFAGAVAAVERQRAEWAAWVALPPEPPVRLPTLAFSALPSTLTAQQVRPLLPVLDGAPSPFDA